MGGHTGAHASDSIKVWATGSYENQFEDTVAYGLLQPRSEYGNNYRQGSLGFRLDKDLSDARQLTLQGSLTSTRTELGNWFPIFEEDSPNGVDVLDIIERKAATVAGRYYKALPRLSELTLDFSLQNDESRSYALDEKTNLLELDMQQNIRHWQQHDVVLGARVSYGRKMATTHTNLIELTNATGGLIDGADIQDQSVFIQDEITLPVRDQTLTLGLKWEKFQGTSSKLLPQIRWMWHPTPEHLVWSAISRTNRSPSLAEKSGRFTLNTYLPETPGLPSTYYTTLVVLGSPELESEKTTTWEAGFRSRISKTLTVDATLFHNQHDRLRDGEFQSIRIDGREISGTFTMSNTIDGTTSGAEIYADFRPTPQWRFQLGANYLDFNLSSSLDVTQNLVDLSAIYSTSSPKFQTSLRASWTPIPPYEFDLWWRHIDDISFDASGTGNSTLVDAYDTLMLRASWHPHPNIEITLVGKNLLDQGQIEYAEEFWTFPKDVPRSYYLGLRYRL